MDLEGEIMQRTCIRTILKQRILKNKNTFAALLDLEKVFDRIDCNLLFYKILDTILMEICIGR